MLLGLNELQKMVADNQLVENLCDRELNNPEGTGYDLRLGAVYEISGKTYLGQEKRSGVDSKALVEYKEDKLQTFTFKPGTYHLIKTIETVNLPEDVLAQFYPRSTFYRSGLHIFSGNASPGYSGELTFGIANLGQCEMEVELGARVSHVVFFRTDAANSYRGQWKGGRVTIKGEEEQV